AGVPQYPGHDGTGRPGRRLAGPCRRRLGLPDRRARALRLGQGRGRGHAPPGGLGVPARLRTRPEENFAMSRLRIFTEADPANPIETYDVHELIGYKLAEVGVRFERWKAAEPIVAGDPPEK